MPKLRTAATKLAVALVAGSLLFSAVWPQVALNPSEVFLQLYLWQPVSYVFVAGTPGAVIFGALILWTIGGSLEHTWGSRKLVVFGVGVSVVAGVLSVALWQVLELLPGARLTGGEAMCGALWVAYGLSWGQRQTNFWGLPVTGNVLALIGVGFVVLQAAYFSPLSVIPEGIAVAIAAAYVKFNFPLGGWEKLTAWRLRRRVERRRSHLNVVAGDKRNTRGDSDRYLH